MKDTPHFPHPGISLPILERRAGQMFLDLLALYGDALTTRGRSLLRNASFPSEGAERAAISRLRKQGVVARRRRGDNEPVLVVTSPGGAREESLRPQRFWQERWQGVWSVLVYDVPEKQRAFRNALRHTLTRQRMGCLQKSVWISPRDIRPLYDDLQQAVGIHIVSYLFHAQTVLGRETRDLVLAAWDFDRLRVRHLWFIESCRRNLHVLRSGRARQPDLGSLAREELQSYLSVMQNDPLLPKDLLPAGYAGIEAHKLHTEFVEAVKRAARRPA
jgi:phenylacetic acid degradation operon negative regulatory protein